MGTKPKHFVSFPLATGIKPKCFDFAPIATGTEPKPNIATAMARYKPSCYISRPYNRHTNCIPAQYSDLTQLFISPFDAERKYASDGSWQWVPIERNLQPTGIMMLDLLLQFFADGNYDRKQFYHRYGLTTGPGKEENPFYGFVRVLTGVDIRELHNRFVLHTADLLLQYTDMTIKDIAHRAGSYSGSTLHALYRRYYHCGTRARRLQLRSYDNRVGWYRVADIDS